MWKQIQIVLLYHFSHPPKLPPPLQKITIQTPLPTTTHPQNNKSKSYEKYCDASCYNSPKLYRSNAEGLNFDKLKKVSITAGLLDLDVISITEVQNQNPSLLNLNGYHKFPPKYPPRTDAILNVKPILFSVLLQPLCPSFFQH
jgi:hypothetical protein